MTPEEWLRYSQQMVLDQAASAARIAAINTNMPSWAQVETALDNVSNLTEAKAALKKIARVVYWLAKNKLD